MLKNHFMMVRVGEWDPATPVRKRRYVQIRAGFGEGVRAENARVRVERADERRRRASTS